MKNNFSLLRLTLWCTMSVSIAASMAPAAEQSSPQTYPTAAHFPLAAGMRWEYLVRERTGTGSFTMHVVMEPVLNAETTTYHILTQTDPRGRMRSFLVASDAGVVLVKTALSKNILGIFSPPVYAVHHPPIPLFLGGPASESFSWKGTITASFIEKQVTLTGRFVGTERVSVPAGSFDCVKFWFSQTRDGVPFEEYAWYARGIGQVKYVGGKYIKELKKFTP